MFVISVAKGLYLTSSRRERLLCPTIALVMHTRSTTSVRRNHHDD